MSVLYRVLMGVQPHLCIRDTHMADEIPFPVDAKLRPTLWLACKNGLYDDVKKLLLEPNVDIEERGGRYNTTPLMVAAHHYRTSIVQLLIDSSADTSARDDRGMTALRLATSEQHLPIMYILLKSGNIDDKVLGWPVAGCKVNQRHLRL